MREKFKFSWDIWKTLWEMGENASTKMTSKNDLDFTDDLEQLRNRKVVSQ